MNNCEGHNDQVLSINYNRSCTRIVSGSKDKTIIIWDVNRYNIIKTLVGKHLIIM